MNRAALRRLGLAVGVAIAVGGCVPDVEWVTDQPKRIQLFQECLRLAGSATPQSLADRGSWSEVVEQCDAASFDQAKVCVGKDCTQNPASGMSAGTAEARSGSGPQDRQPDPQGDAQ